jgi:hypothetical protein
MKKSLVLIIALVIFPTIAHAQTGDAVVINIELDTGAHDVITFSGSRTSDAVSLYDVNSGRPSRFRVGLGVGSVDGNWGITTRLDSEILQSGGLAASWNRALVWGKLFDRLVTVKAGLLDEEAFSFTWRPWGAENTWGAQFDGNIGVELQVRPVGGLEVGYILPVEDGARFSNSLMGSYFAAAYEMPAVFSVVAGVQLASTPHSSDAWLGLDVKAWEGVTARLAALAENIGGAKTSWLEIYQEAGYVLAGVGLNLKAWEEVYALADSGVGWQVEATVSYPIGIATVALSGDLGNLVAQDPNPAIPTLQPLGCAIASSVAFALAASSTVQVGGRFKVGDFDVSRSTLEIFVSFRWAFGS